MNSLPSLRQCTTAAQRQQGGVITKLIAILVVLLIAYLLLAPTQVAPVSWSPTKAPTLTGLYATNTRLAALTRIGQKQGLKGPESFIVDNQGEVITGLADGRVVRVSAYGEHVETLGDTGGRPLGLALHPDGRLIIADGRKGLLALNKDKSVSVLVTSAAGVALGFCDDVVISKDGRYAYFSDASSRWGYGQDGIAVMEHGGDGRLLRYDFKSKETRVLLSDLEFANGVALGANEAFVLVNETGAYRISRYWLSGDKAGSHDLFIDNLPGLPDNLSFNGKDRFWVALFTPRNILLDTFAGYPFVRKILVRALTLFPAPIEHRAMVLALDNNGQVIANLQDGSAGNYSPITSVREAGAWLWFGSLTQDSLARLPLPEALAVKP